MNWDEKSEIVQAALTKCPSLDIVDVCKLITAIIRQSHFNETSLENAIQNGLLSNLFELLLGYCYSIQSKIHLLDILQFKDIDSDKKIRVIRHKDRGIDLWDLYHNGSFEEYQSGQSWNVFGDAEYVISFIAESDKYAKFVGVWKVTDKTKCLKTGHHHYQMIEVNGFEQYKTRLIVNWGLGTRSWSQWLHKAGNKEVVEILPSNYVKDFTGFYDFMLSYRELKQMIENPDSNREWQRMLSKSSGVYLILNEASGEQYVGSAYGKNGLWHRWGNYAKNPSGGNKLLNNLLGENPDAYKYFKFSILRVLEPNSTKEEVIAQESLIKRKLGSRAFGLNAN